MEANSNHPGSLSNRRSRSRTTDIRVRFAPEVNNEQNFDPKDNALSSDPEICGSPTHKLPTTQATQRGERPPSKVPGTSTEHATDAAFSPAPPCNVPPEESVAAVEETSSDESRGPDDHAPVSARTHVPSRNDNSIRSGIKGLLKANKKVAMVDTNTINVLESLLSQIGDDSGNRLVSSPIPAWTNHSAFRTLANPRPVNLAARTRTGPRFVGCSVLNQFSLTEPK